MVEDVRIHLKQNEGAYGMTWQRILPAAVIPTEACGTPTEHAQWRNLQSQKSAFRTVIPKNSSGGTDFSTAHTLLNAPCVPVEMTRWGIAVIPASFDTLTRIDDAIKII